MGLHLCSRRLQSGAVAEAAGGLPAALTITAQGGEITFGALEAGRQEGDEVDGEGAAELLNDGSLEIEFEPKR